MRNCERSGPQVAIQGLARSPGKAPTCGFGGALGGTRTPNLMAGITFGEIDLAFQRVEDYRPPRWPDDDHPKQYHLDFEVDEIDPRTAPRRQAWR